jgi:hypothetical protein
MVGSFGRRNNDSGERILNSLETIERRRWKTVKEGIAVIELCGDKRMSE